MLPQRFETAFIHGLLSGLTFVVEFEGFPFSLTVESTLSDNLSIDFGSSFCLTILILILIGRTSLFVFNSKLVLEHPQCEFQKLKL